MGPDRAIDLMNSMLWNAVIIGGPIMMATLIVGLLISVFQVATQIQEITLSYVPKILTAVLMCLAPLDNSERHRKWASMTRARD